MKLEYKGITIEVENGVRVLTEDTELKNFLTENDIEFSEFNTLENFIKDNKSKFDYQSKNRLKSKKNWMTILKITEKSDKPKNGFHYVGKMHSKRMQLDFKSKENLEVGKTYLITGEVKDDTWYNKNSRSNLEKRLEIRKVILYPKNIKEINFAEVKKDYTKPRYELHAHTVHSRRDAHMTHTQLKEAFEDGKLGSLAITNHGIPNCFVDSIKNFSKSEHNVICGTELYVVDDYELNKQIEIFNLNNYTLVSDQEEKISKIEELTFDNNDDKKKVESIKETVNKMTEETKSFEEKVKLIEDKEKKKAAKQIVKDMKAKKTTVRKTSADTKLRIKERNLEIKTLKAELKVIEADIKEVLKLKPNLGDAKRRHVVCLVKDGFETTMNFKGKEVPYNKAIYEFNKMITKANIENFAVPVVEKWLGKRPVVLLSELEKNKEWFTYGSACSMGFIVDAIIEKDELTAEKFLDIFDYIEIQPMSNNFYLLEPQHYYDYKTINDLKDLNRRVFDFAKKHGKKVVFTSDAHTIAKEERFKRAIFKKSYFSMFESKNTEPDYKKVLKGAREESQPFLHSYDEMVEELQNQGFNEEEIEWIYNNEKEISEGCARFNNTTVIPDQLFIPEFPGIDVKVEVPKLAFEKMKEMYGDNPDPTIKERLEFELEKVSMRGFEFIYYISRKIVEASEEIGFPVGSRGSIGSSLLAMFLGVTDNNPLKPHQHCPNCHHHVWLEDVKHGFDKPREECPHCKTIMSSDGFDGRFTSFLGFSFNKMPD